ncbi:hypothetical protein SLA2020_100940 [Shorea laevis]
MGEDVFWAIRGGGGASFGVILSFKIKLVPVPETVTVFRAERFLDKNATDLVFRWQTVAPTTDPNLFMGCLFSQVQETTSSQPKSQLSHCTWAMLIV